MTVLEFIFFVALALVVAHFYRKPSWRVTRELAEDWKATNASQAPAPRRMDGLWQPRWGRKAAWIGVWALPAISAFVAIENGVPHGKVGAPGIIGLFGVAITLAHLLFYAVLAALGRAFREQVTGDVLDGDRAERRGVWWVTLVAAGLVVVTAKRFVPEFIPDAPDAEVLPTMGTLLLVLVFAVTAVMRSRDIVRTGVPYAVLMEAGPITRALEKQAAAYQEPEEQSDPVKVFFDPTNLDDSDPCSYWYRGS